MYFTQDSMDAAREELGREVASADEARRILKIGTWYNSVEETLDALGLPPNRKGGQMGFCREVDEREVATPGSVSDGHAIAGQVQI